MCEDRLTGLALLTLATDIEVKPEEVVERFLKRSRHRIQYAMCTSFCRMFIIVFCVNNNKCTYQILNAYFTFNAGHPSLPRCRPTKFL
jgi:hypothetical protein